VVKRFRCDGGGEFDNAEVKKLLGELGVEHVVCAPYTPEQNGSIERENRTIVESARSSLCSSKLPKTLWAEACATAVYVLNHTGNSSVPNRTPFELWYGRKLSNFNHLRIFGTKCFVYVQKRFRSKFDSKAKF